MVVASSRDPLTIRRQDNAVRISDKQAHIIRNAKLFDELLRNPALNALAINSGFIPNIEKAEQLEFYLWGLLPDNPRRSDNLPHCLVPQQTRYEQETRCLIYIRPWFWTSGTDSTSAA